jgi:hypoxanthine phosphoribosyltransferase
LRVLGGTGGEVRAVADDEQGQFYSYESRRGVLPVSWDDFAATYKGLALAVAPYEPDVILGVARGGLYPATLLSHLLQAELYPIRLTRRFKDAVVHGQPIWLVRPPATIADQKVLIVDEICSGGTTIAMVRDEVRQLGARESRSAVLYAHRRGADIPDYIGIISDALILNPGDREIVRAGRFVPHPEYLHAFRQQGLGPPPSLLTGIAARDLAKGMP